jgi:hypothetical protein
MLILRYFITVGIALTLGLFALGNYLEPAASTAGARVAVAPTTASLVHFAPSPTKPVQAKAAEVKPAPTKPAHGKLAHRSR